MKRFSLKVLWLENSIAFSLDQVSKDKFIPLTEFYFWPQKDAWELIKNYIEDLNWVSQEEAIVLLNQITEVINYWQNRADSGIVSVNTARLLFPNVSFVGSD